MNLFMIRGTFMAIILFKYAFETFTTAGQHFTRKY